MELRRETLHLTQQQLASRAKVSSRTISALISQEKTSIRADVIVRLAVALEANPEEWLELAKVSASDAAIEINRNRVQSHSQGDGEVSPHQPSEIAPQDFFEDLKDLANSRGLLCVYYSTPPVLSGIHSDLQPLLVRRIQEGMDLAMFIPSSLTQFDFPRGPRRHVGAHWEMVASRVKLLAGSIIEQLQSDAKGSIRVVQPKRETNVGAQSVVFPCTWSQNRPMLALSSRKEIFSDKHYDLYEWQTSIDEKDDHIHQYLSPQAHPLLALWKGFFFDVITSWSTNEAGCWEGAIEGGAWENIEI